MEKIFKNLDPGAGGGQDYQDQVQGHQVQYQGGGLDLDPGTGGDQDYQSPDQGLEGEVGRGNRIGKCRCNLM